MKISKTTKDLLSTIHLNERKPKSKKWLKVVPVLFQGTTHGLGNVDGVGGIPVDAYGVKFWFGGQ